MSNSFGDLQDLIERVHSEPRPVCFLIGSGCVSGVLPRTEAIVQQIADLLENADLSQGAGQAPYDAYQHALAELKTRRGAPGVQALLRDVVLTAWTGRQLDVESLTERALEDLEADAGAWRLPQGLQALADLLVARPDKFAAPILTTNFDPLIEVAIRRAGGVPAHFGLDQDGRFDRVGGRSITFVIHLHGYWLGAYTLHSAAELTRPRPQLAGSLRTLLRSRFLVVLGYGGWDDIFTHTLLDELDSATPDLSVAWTFRADSERDVEDRHPDIVRRCLGQPGVSLYLGVDSDRLLTAIRQEESAVPAGTYAETGRPWTGPARSDLIPGWIELTRSFFDSISANLTPLELRAFFDGRAPGWPEAISPQVPHRELVSDVVKRLSMAAAGRGRMCLILGPAGEGKSTILHQAASSLARRNGKFRVLWRRHGLLDVQYASNLPQETARWVLVSDDADELVDPLRDLVAQLAEAGRKDVDLLMAAKDTDWLAAGGQRVGWANFIDLRQETVRGLSPADAASVVRAWTQLGEEGLLALKDLRGDEERVQALLEAAAEPLVDEGAFLGAMLEVRYANGLRDHVRTLMARLQDRPLPPHSTLLQAFVSIAALHAADVRNLRPATLARALGLGAWEIEDAVVLPLGQEAAVAVGGRAILTRHRSIARAAMELASDFQISPAAVYAALVRASVELVNAGEYIEDYDRVAYLSRTFVRPEPFLARWRPEIARAAATAAREAEPDRLSFAVSECMVLRETGDPQKALSVAKEAFDGGAERWKDFDEEAQGLIYEWGVIWGNLGVYDANALMAAASLSDLRDVAALRRDQARYGLNGLRIALDKLQEGPRDQVLQDASHGVTYLLWCLEVKPDSAERPRPDPSKLNESLLRLSRALSQIWQGTGARTLEQLPDIITDPPFEQLRQMCQAPISR